MEKLFYALKFTQRRNFKINVHDCLKTNILDHFYTKNASPKGDWKAQGIEFWAYPE